jgi:hypothetical protein
MGTFAGWGDFLVAAAGAASALAGLVFVALSINLTRILELPGVSGRAGETILLLATALVSALLALIPGQSPSRLGTMLLVVWLVTWGLPTIVQVRIVSRRDYQRFRYWLMRFTLHQGATMPLLLAGLSLRGYVAGGLRWLAAALILSLIVALINAWVLLVEIVR